MPPGTPIVLIPRSALRRDGEEPYVWTVVDGHARRQAVTVGTELGEQVQIAAGLHGDEMLVIGDATAVRDGAAVRVGEK